MDSVGKYKDNKNSNIDRGKWKYVVCFGTIITFVAGIGHVNSFGLIYRDFIIETGSSAKSVTTAHGIFAIMLAIGGFILNIISRNYSLRLGGLIGAFIFCFGSFLTTIVSNTNQLPATYGICQGIGFGMMVPVCYSTINYYFVTKRTQVMSIIKGLQGFVLIWYPQILKFLMLRYGFRETLLLIAGMSLNTFPGIAVMITSKKSSENKHKTASDVENGQKSFESFNLLNAEKNNDLSDNDSHQSSKNNRISEIIEIILGVFNVKILKDLTYCNICIGQSFVNFSDLTYFFLQPMLLYQYGYDTNQVALCISISAGADVAGRFGLALMSSVVSIDTKLLFYMATLFTMIVRIVLLQLRDFFSVACVTGLLGVLRAALHVASPLVIANHVEHQDFTGAYSFSLLAAGIVNASLSPFIGLLKDIYQDYVPAFYALTFCCVPCLLLWSMEYLIRRKQNKI